MSEERKKLSPTLRRNLTIGSIIVIGIVLAVYIPSLLSIIQPEPPKEGIGYGKVVFYDPVADEYYDGVYSLVAVNNTEEWYQLGINTDEPFETDRPCYAVFNGSGIEGIADNTYYPITIPFETNKIEENATMNIIALRRIVDSADVDATIYRVNNSFGIYTANDISNVDYSVDVYFNYRNDDYENSWIAMWSWLPSMLCDSEAISLNKTGWGFWMAFVGVSECPLKNDTYLLEGMERPIIKSGNVAIIYLIVDYNESYNSYIKLYTTTDIDYIVMYNGLVSDYDNVDRTLVTIP